MSDYTNEFDDWFGPSVVRNDSGLPLVMYHGTASDFLKFSTPSFFTSEREVAEEYADLRSDDVGTDENRAVKEVFLAIRNPACEEKIRDVASSLGLHDEMVFALIDPRQNGGMPRLVINALLSEGYDGAIIEDFDFSGNPFDAYVTFSSDQIKYVSEVSLNKKVIGSLKV